MIFEILLVEHVVNKPRIPVPVIFRSRLREGGDLELEKALQWSLEVNASIADMVHGVAPFPLVRESLEKLSNKADMLVVSATPNAALRQEWREHGIAKFVTEICGQESGNKQETLTNSVKYKPNHSLMIGDAPGDQRA